MGITITESSKETISRLIRNAFDSIDPLDDIFNTKSNNLIKTAKECGLTECSQGMIDDLSIR